jgi:glycosyltransferase involved in cell wall biosynthesis
MTGELPMLMAPSVVRLKKLISIVIPAYNEEEVLDELRKRLSAVMDSKKGYDFEVIVVENGSADSSLEKLIAMNRADGRFKVLQLSRNFGCDGGITAGLRYAGGDAAIVMNADLQDPPELIPEFIDRWEKGYDIVYGVIGKREGVGLVRRFFSAAFYRIINTITDNTIPENVSDFRLIDRSVYATVNRMNERNRLLRGIIAWTGFRQAGIPYHRPPRYAGESKVNYFNIFKLALNGIFSFSYLPLKAATVLGFALSLISFALIGVEIALFLVYGRQVPGFTTLVILVLFLSGMQFLIMGMLGEYIARIYDEAKQRPNFIVKRAIGFRGEEDGRAGR